MPYVNVNGTSGNNFMIFQGIMGFYNETLVNPYTGTTISVSGNLNINNGIYDGLGGTDTLSMTSFGDVLTLVDANGVIMVKNVEMINAGLDGDVVNMSHATVTYGNLTIRGSDGDDILWSNLGNDLILGGSGNDNIIGGGGNDTLFGGLDDDNLSGWEGTDSLFGGAGNDTFQYHADSLWSGGYTLASLGSSIPFAATVNLDGKNRSHDTFHGDADEALNVSNTGIDTLILTSGNDVLVASDALSPTNNIFFPRVAYIDIVEAGDGDDVVDFSGVDSVAVTINGGNGHDVLGGSSGNDTLNGDAGNDRLYGAAGDDVLNGGTGDDRYYYNLGESSDIITETSGTDSIVFGEGITFADLSFTIDGSHLYVSVAGESLKIVDHFAGDHSGRVESILFHDGSTFDLASYGINPELQDDVFYGDEDTVITGNVLGNDVADSGDTLTVVADTITTVNGGTVVVNADGSFSYQGASNFHGTETFSYTVNDNNGGMSTASVTLHVASVNDSPVSVDDIFSGNEDEVISGNVLDNDSDVDGDVLSVDAQTITTANGGTVTLNADGTFSYLGAANFNGNDTFNYTVRDTAGGYNMAAVTIAVAAVNDAPVTQDDHFSGIRNNDILGNVLAGDTDIDGDTLSVEAGTFATEQGGIVVLNSDGSFTYKPANGYYGADSFGYTALDGNGGSAMGTVNLNVDLDTANSTVGTENGETITGTNGNDQIFGLGGDDILYGDDDIFGLITMDKAFADTVAMPTLKEGVNITNLRPSGDPARGINQGNLSVDYDATASITFRKGYAGHDNSFGTFGIAADGTIVSTSMEWANVKTAGIDVTHQIDLPVGTDGGAFGFFIVANGNNTNGGYTGLDVTGDGKLSFVYDYGKATQRAAKVTDPGAKISLVYSDGITTKVLKGDVFFTTDRGNSAALNKDNKVHVVSGLLDTNSLTLNPKAADLVSKPVSFEKNGMTVSALLGTLIGSGDKIGIKSSTGSNVISGNEAVHVSLSQGAEKVIFSLSDIAGNGTGIDFKIYLNGSTTPVLFEHVINGSVSGGKLDILLDSSNFGGGVITGVSISSIANSAHALETFYIDNINAHIPGGLDTNTLRIGFEDLYNTGDADYEDVLFDLDINPVTVGNTQGGNDFLDGGAGNDILYGGGGDDILVIGDGYDQAYGGAGADVFALSKIDTLVDKIHDFNASEGDSINITDVLESYDPLADHIADFVRFVQTGADTELQISAHGDGNFVAAALIVGGTDDTIATLISNGALVADQTALA